jgi:hypothetical protein
MLGPLSQGRHPSTGVDDFSHLTQPCGKGILHRGVVDDWSAFDGVSDWRGQVFDQYAVEDRLAGIVGEIQNGIGLGLRSAQRRRSIDFKGQIERPLRRRLQHQCLV